MSHEISSFNLRFLLLIESEKQTNPTSFPEMAKFALSTLAVLLVVGIVANAGNSFVSLVSISDIYRFPIILFPRQEHEALPRRLLLWCLVLLPFRQWPGMLIHFVSGSRY